MAFFCIGGLENAFFCIGGNSFCIGGNSFCIGGVKKFCRGGGGILAFLYKGGQILAIIDVSADTFSHFSCHIIRHIELIPMKYISEGSIYADYMQPIY